MLSCEEVYGFDSAGVPQGVPQASSSQSPFQSLSLSPFLSHSNLPPTLSPIFSTFLQNFSATVPSVTTDSQLWRFILKSRFNFFSYSIVYFYANLRQVHAASACRTALAGGPVQLVYTMETALKKY